MNTFVVYGKGDSAIKRVHAIASSRDFYHRSSFRIKPPRFWQYQPRFEVRFHDLTAYELSAIKVKLSFIHGITKTQLI